jgi:hypothetical protein
MNSKNCIKCNNVLPLSEFSKDSRASSGLKSVCKGCNKKCTSQYYANNKEKLCADRKLKRDSNKETIKKRNAEYYIKSKLNKIAPDT